MNVSKGESVRKGSSVSKGESKQPIETLGSSSLFISRERAREMPSKHHKRGPTKRELADWKVMQEFGQTAHAISQQVGRDHKTVMKYLRSPVYQSDAGLGEMVELIKRRELEDLYLTVLCRHAVAHAGDPHNIDPDDDEKLGRLHVAAEVLRELARHLIRTEMVFSEHYFDGS